MIEFLGFFGIWCRQEIFWTYRGSGLGKPLFEKWSVQTGFAHIAFNPPPLQTGTVGHFFNPIFPS